MTENNTEKKNRAVLVGLSSRALAPEENADEASMEELSALLETAGGECVGVVTQSKDSPDPRTFIGEGKVAEVKELAHAMDADMVIFDNGLSPSQQRVLSEDLGVSVLDRSALIPMRANPPCSTGSPGRPSRPMTGCSTPWTPPPAPWRSPTPARCSSPTRWALSASCPTIWWRPSRPPWRSWSTPTCCSM